MPQIDPQSVNRGNGSTIDGWTEKNVYLTRDSATARRYAVSEAAHSGGTPIVLQIEADTAHLVPDDDFIANYVYRHMARLYGWDENPGGPVAGKSLGLHRLAEAAGNTTAYAKELINAANAAMSVPWQDALADHGQIAYRGVIPSSQIAEAVMKISA